MPEILHFLMLQVIAMGITIFLIPRLWVTNIFGAVFIVAAIAGLNATLWDPELFFALPDNLSLQSLLLLLINGFIFWALVKILPGIEVKGLLPALVAPVVFTVLSVLISTYGVHVDWWGILQSIFDTLRNLVSSASSG